MHLRDLPIDGVRAILLFCDLRSLVWLYATFDLRIQKCLRSRLAIPLLDLSPLRTLPVAPTRYLLQALQDIQRLEIPNDAEWSPSSLSLFPSLNPSELCFGSRLLHPSAKELATEASLPSAEYSIRQLADFMKPAGFPNLPLLTPRLHTLEVRCILSNVCFLGNLPAVTLQNVDLPACLTSLSLPETPAFKPDVARLPTGLTQLSLGWISAEVVFATFEHLPSLESLSLSYIPGIDHTAPDFAQFEHVRAPSSLTRLQITSQYFPAFVFAGPLLERCHLLTRFDASCDLLSGHGQPIDASKVQLPASIRSFSVSRTRRLVTPMSQVSLPALPPSLTELKLKDINKKLLDAELPRLPATLTKLSLSEPPRSKNMPYEKLPSTLKWLELVNQSTLSPATLDSFPPSLTELHMLNFLFADLPTLRSRAPNCRLYVSGPVRLDSGKNGQFLIEKFKSLLTPTLDVVALHNALNLYGTSERVHFTLDSYGTSAEYLHNPKNLIYRPSMASETLLGQATTWPLIGVFVNTAAHFRSLDRLDVDEISLTLDFSATVSPLTRMDLGNGHITVKSLPPWLTHLTSTATVDASLLAVPRQVLKLSVLDVPNWSFSGPYLVNCSFENCSTLKCKIVGINDFEVVPFLTKQISRQTRLNTSLSLSVFPTGALVGDEAENGPRHVDYDTLRQLTLPQLKLKLDAPMLLPAPQLRGAVATGSFQTIGAVLNSLSCVDVDRNGPDCLSVPFSATSVSYSRPTGWKLVPKEHYAASPNAASSSASLSLKSPIEVSSSASPPAPQVPLYFSPSNILTHLELFKVIEPSTWWSFLPQSLKAIRIVSSSILDLPGTFPPQLETLILEDGLTSQERPYSQDPGWSFSDTVTPWSPALSLAHSAAINATAPKRLTFSLKALPSTLKDLAIVPPSSFTLNEADSARFEDLSYSNLPALRRVIFGDLRRWNANLMKILPLAQLSCLEIATRNCPFDAAVFTLAPDDPVSPSGSAHLTYTRNYSSTQHWIKPQNEGGK